jgi:carbonic anhydrase
MKFKNSFARSRTSVFLGVRKFAMQDEQDCDFSRRGFLLGSGAILGALLPPAAQAQTPSSPDSVLQELKNGNARFVSGRLTACNHDFAALRQHTVDKQAPFAAVLACSDSRVPVELIFDQTLGDLFVVRNAGNVATAEAIASIEYAAAELGIKLIVAMGHGGCGAVKATIAGKPVPGQISALFSHIQPAVDQAGPNLEPAIKANAKIQADLLRKASTVVSGLLNENKLKVIAAYYDLASGKVTILG